MTTPQLATAADRIYNLPDVISALNDDVNQANMPDTASTVAFTNLVSGYETAIMVDTPVAAVFALPTYSTGQWGFSTWS